MKKLTAIVPSVFLAGCASYVDIDTIDISAIKDSNNKSVTSVPWGDSVTVYADFKLDKAVERDSQHFKIEIWEDDDPAGDDHLAQRSPILLKGKTKGTAKIKLTCTKAKGHLKGNKGTDSDDGNSFEIYAYNKADNVYSSEKKFSCVKPAPKDDEDDSSDKRSLK